MLFLGSGVDVLLLQQLIILNSQLAAAATSGGRALRFGGGRAPFPLGHEPAKLHPLSNKRIFSWGSAEVNMIE
jgi:hypothetical protein